MSLRKKAITGSAWTFISSGSKALIQILRLSILTRLLEKSDFGVVAIATVVLGFTQLFSDLGISTALFSRNDLTTRQKSSIYWSNFLLSTGIYVLIVLLTPLIVVLYPMPDLNMLLPIMGLDLIISASSKQFRVYKQKDLQFHQLGLIDIFTSLVSLVLAWYLAKGGYGVYSLVLSTIFASFTSSLLIIITTLKKHEIIFYLNIKEVKPIYRIGLYQSGAQILDYFSSQLDILILGKITNTSELGVYNLIKQLIVKLYGLVNPIFSSVSIPLLSKIKDDNVLLKNKYLQGLGIVALFTSGIYGFLSVVPREVLEIFYGNDFGDNYLILQVLCTWAIFSSLGNFCSTIVVVSGRTDLNLSWTIIRIIFSSVFIIIGSFWGIIGIVTAQSLFMFMFYFVYWKVVVNRVMPSIGLKEYYFYPMKQIFITLILSGICILLVHPFMRQHIHNDFLIIGLMFILYLLLYSLVKKNDIRKTWLFIFSNRRSKY